MDDVQDLKGISYESCALLTSKGREHGARLRSLLECNWVRIDSEHVQCIIFDVCELKCQSHERN